MTDELYVESEGRGAPIVLLHGWGMHGGIWDECAAALADDWRVSKVDLPGHGLSTGEPVAIDEFATYGRAVASVVSQAAGDARPLWVMAQSTGCAALVEFSRIHPWPFQAAALMARLVRPVSWTRIRLGHSLIRHFTETVRRTFTRNSSDAEFLAFHQRDPLQPRHLTGRPRGACH